MIIYHKYECEKCKSKNTRTEEWEGEYSKYRMFTCLDCGYVVVNVKHKAKIKEVLL